MSSSTNRKPSAQKIALNCHCGLSAAVCNANTLWNKWRKFFGCANFKEIGGRDFSSGLKVMVTTSIQVEKNNDAQLMK
ncbi:hypothetical protein ERO13_A10G111502v2 [Gossypium hirsutum]|uniref:Uncharacterized protein n=1 Tax=Gossypium darwinii TaxID=34276 RepID=A0A5D2EXY6_GOSDA|nr:hypothetical protein ERO13_A10G111502v2 [Gossypium hirsutum]TYG98634.1 hypothetical protein ES288_A10G132900v1 [Gossypium darwinii]